MRVLRRREIDSRSSILLAAGVVPKGADVDEDRRLAGDLCLTRADNLAGGGSFDPKRGAEPCCPRRVVATVVLTVSAPETAHWPRGRAVAGEASFVGVP